MNYIYLPERKYNMNAIDFYIKILEDAFRNNGEDVERISNLKVVKKGDRVVVIVVNDFVKVLLKKRSVKIYMWFQGITPEEMIMNLKGWERFKVNFIWTILEIMTLWFSKGNVMVSEAMVDHFRKKYGYKRQNYTIMPCFNQELKPNAFSQSKYESPTFVYSGSLAKWQCFDTTIDTFKVILKAIPSAKLAIFTGMVDEAKRIVAEKGLSNVLVKNVPYTELEDEIKGFKYGFLIRDDLKLNNVATPTKMSSYIGCGIIPIYSPYIKDYDKQFKNKKYFVRVGSEKEMIDKLVQLEREDILAKDVYEEYSEIFNTYYSRERYIEEISDFYKKNDC